MIQTEVVSNLDIPGSVFHRDRIRAVNGVQDDFVSRIPTIDRCQIIRSGTLRRNAVDPRIADCKFPA